MRSVRVHLEAHPLTAPPSLDTYAIEKRLYKGVTSVLKILIRSSTVSNSLSASMAVSKSISGAMGRNMSI